MATPLSPATLSRCQVLIIGVGGLGCAAAQALVLAGVGRLVLVDFDTVSVSNLPRQLLFSDQDLGLPKVLVAQRYLQQLQATADIVALKQALTEEQLQHAVAAADVVLDCSDNFATRFAVNAACVQQCTPLVSGAAIEFGGQISTFLLNLPHSPCYACLYPEAAEAEAVTCTTNGVLAPVPGVIGQMQALEAIKLLLNIGQPLYARLLVFNALKTRWRILRLTVDPACPVCGH